MSTRPAPAALLVLTVVALFVPVAMACVSYNEEQLSENMIEARERVDRLWSGTIEDRLLIAGFPYPHFRPLEQEDISPEDKEIAEDVVESLRLLLDSGSDEFVVSQLLEGLRSFPTELLSPLYRDALAHRSPNIRWRGVRRFAGVRDPDVVESLERMWEAEQRRWIRLDLVLALGCQQSDRHAAEILEWLDFESDADARAGLTYLAAVGGEETIPRMAGLAGKSSNKIRQMLVELMARWPGSDAGLDVVLDASASEHPLVRRAAARALLGFDRAEARERLLTLAFDDPEREVRDAAVRNLGHLGSFEDVQSALESSADFVSVDRVRRAIGHNDAKGMSIESKMQNLVERWPACGRPIDLDRDAREMQEIVPVDGLETVRCWIGPHLEGDPVIAPRVPAGRRARTFDLHENAGGIWYAARVQGFGECWFPASDLRPVEPEPGPAARAVLSGRGESSPDDPGTDFRSEFDLPSDEFRTVAVQRLLDAGLLQTIDRGVRVTGVELRIDRDAGDRLDEVAKVVAGAFDRGESILDRQLARAALWLRAQGRGAGSLAHVLEVMGGMPPEREWRSLRAREIILRSDLY